MKTFLAVLAPFVLLACGGDSKPTETPNNQTTSTSATDTEIADDTDDTTKHAPFDTSAVPPGKGWTCFATPLGSLWCERSASECARYRTSAGNVAKENGASDKEAAESTGACEAAQPYCFTNKSTVRKLTCFATPDDCKMHIIGMEESSRCRHLN